MADNVWEVTATDRETAGFGLRLQAELAGLDPDEESVAKFLKHQQELIASLNAEVRFIRNIINAPLQEMGDADRLADNEDSD